MGFHPRESDFFYSLNAKVHLFDTGHFALETHGDEIAKLMRGFLGGILK